MERILIIFLILGLTSSCNTKKMSRQNSVIYWVNSYKVDCVGVAPMSCLQIQKGDTLTNEWQNFYSSIEGFDYRPGFLYKLAVRETKRPAEQVPADASSIRYELIEVLEKRPDRKLRLNDIWVLEAIGGELLSQSEVTVNKSRPRLEIHIARGQFMGTDGCNQFRGAIQTVDDNRLSFGPAAGTKMACPDMELPNRFNQALSRTHSYFLEDRELVLKDDTGREVLRFRKTD